MIVELACAHQQSGDYEPFLIFRKKKKPLGAQFLKALDQAGVKWAEVPASPKWSTVSALRRLIRDFNPDAFVAHGTSEHIWGRMAAAKERVPVIAWVEQNMERYKFYETWLSKRLVYATDVIIGVGRGVADNVEGLGYPADKIHVIHNGTDLSHFRQAELTPFKTRETAVLMSGRFASQKDHATLIRAAGLLKARGMAMPVRLAGGGSARHRKKAEQLIEELSLQDVVEILGQRSDIPVLLNQHRVFVLSTRFEGLPLSITEAMAAGCAVVATDVVGPQEMITPGETGWLTRPGDAESLADAIVEAVQGGAAEVAEAGRQAALDRFSIEGIMKQYEALLDRLGAKGGIG